MKKTPPKTGQRTILARGSPRKSRAATAPPMNGARTKARASAPAKWQEARIAYDEHGNIVVLDARVAKRLRQLVIRDRTLEVGFPESDMGVKGAELAELKPPPGGVRPLNNQCQCGSLRLAVVAEDTPFRTRTPLF